MSKFVDSSLCLRTLRLRRSGLISSFDARQCHQMPAYSYNCEAVGMRLENIRLRN